MAFPRSKLVICGPSSSGKATLLAGLEFLLGLTTRGSSASVAATAGGRTWHLRTRYYTVALEVCMVAGSAWCAPEAPACAAALEGAEAVVLVLDATAPCDLDAASVWARLAADAGVSTLLCVTNKADLLASGTRAAEWEEGAHCEAAAAGGAGGEAALLSEADAPGSPELPPFAQRVAAWCLESGFEHVHASATRPRAGGSSRDKYGLPRVLEALECTMWASMERVEEPMAAPARGAQVAGEEDARQGGEREQRREEQHAAVVPAGQGAGAAPLAPPPSSSSGAPDGDGGGESLFRSLVARARGEKGEEEEEAHGASGEEGDEAEDLERLMSEMTRVRDASRGSRMNDAQRREAASRVALQLFSLLGGEEPDGPGESCREGES